MSETHEIVELLREIRDTQAAMATKQEEVLAFVRQQDQDAKKRYVESIELQRQAMLRQKVILVVVLPLFLLCLGGLACLSGVVL